MKIGTLTTGNGVKTTIDLTYLPQYLFWVAATALTSIKVTVLGKGVICDLDADGIAAVSGIRRHGNVTNGYMIPLADGILTGKNVRIEIVNSAAQTPDVFGFSLQKGKTYITSSIQTVLANSGMTFESFAFLGFVSGLDDNDRINVIFVDGHSQDLVASELPEILTLFQYEVDMEGIDNLGFAIDQVTLVPAANRNVYVVKFEEA